MRAARMLVLLALPLAGERPPEIEALIERARAVAPEFGADVLLTLAASPRIPDRAWKRELIDEAFQMAAGAQHPSPRTGGQLTDSTQGIVSVAHDAGLDALTLRTRAVSAILALDAARARAMFDDIVLPEFKRFTCQDSHVPIVAVYYETVGRVAETAFAPKERAEEQHIRWLESKIKTIRSPRQVNPAARLIQSVKVAAEGRQALVDAFAATLPIVAGDDRSFGGARDQRELLGLAVFALKNQFRIAGLLAAMRAYLVRHLQAARCSRNIAADRDPLAPGHPISQFNALIDSGNPEVRPISAEERASLRDSGDFKEAGFWESPKSRQMLERMRWLNHGNRNLPDDKRFWTLEERSTHEWHERYLEMMKAIEDWKADDEPSPLDYFHMRSMAYQLLGRLVPPGPRRDNHMRTFLAYLNQSYALVESHMEWFVHAWRLLRETRSSKDAANRAYLLDEMIQYGNPVISLYAQVAKLTEASR